MGERKKSVEEKKQEFMAKGGVFLGQKEWDEILEKIGPAYKKYVKTTKFNSYGYDFEEEVFWAAARKAGHIVVDGKWQPFYFETYIRPSENGYFNTFVEIDEIAVERISEKSEIVGYLALKALNGEISFEEACRKLRYNEL